MIPDSTRDLEPTLVRELIRTVGPDAVFTDADRLLVYESDGLTRYRGRPSAVVLPRTTAECARVVALVHGAGVAVVPRGAGTGLSGGAVAAPGAVIVGTARMTRILSLEPAARRARVQAGVVNADLAAAAARHGLTYAPDPSSQSACTLGGNVAENSGGPHCLKYGVTTRYVTGLTVVAAGGEVLELGGPPGSPLLDLVGVFVGSEGCFGLATEIELALTPAPEATRTLLAAFPRPEEAGVAVSAIMAEGLLPAALEIVDASTIQAVEESIFAAGYPVGAGAALVVELDGPDAGLDEELARVEALCREAGAGEIRRAHDEAERAALWKGRKKAFGAMGRLAPDLLVQDGTVPRSRLPAVLRQIGEIAVRHGLRVANVFHAGDGNLHPNLLFDRRIPEQVERVEAASREIMQACVDAGGTITGEHGVGLDKRHYMPLVYGPDELGAMDAVRAVFDPLGRWNPGKVLPDQPAPAGRKADGARVAGAAAPAADGEAVMRALEELGIDTAAGPAGQGGGAMPVALPASVEAVAELVRMASARGWRVVPTSLPPERVRPRRLAGRDVAPAVAVSVARLDAIDAYEPADLALEAGAGLAWSALDEAARRHGQWLPVDGWGLEHGTLGGLVAGGGPRALAAAFGAVRDLVLGLTVVTGDGRVLRLGGRVVKNVAGFDLVRLIVGSRGRLGIVTGATVRLYGRPATDRTLTVAGHDLDALEKRMASVLDAPLLPASVELFQGSGDALLAVRVVGSPAGADHALEVMAERLGGESQVLEEPRAAELRATRRAAVAEAPVRVRLHGPASASAVTAALVRARRMGEEAVAGDLRLAALPDQGLLEVGLPDPDAAGAATVAAWISDEAARLAPLGGRVRVVEGPGELRAASMAAPHEPARQASAALVGELRRTFDPAGVLPGFEEAGEDGGTHER